MYGENFTVSDRYKKSTATFINALTENYAADNAVKKSKYEQPFSEEAGMVVESVYRRDANLNRYHSFVETVKNSLVVEALYKVYSESVDESIKEDASNRVVMRSIVNEYVQEAGYDNILRTMKTASATMSEMYNVITKTAKSILEACDKTNPDTFIITPEMKDEFFKSLDYSNSEEISKAINDRVSNAMQDFVTANTKDHEDITTALKQAQEKIAEVPEGDESLKEFYEMKGKRQASEIRNAPKGVFHGMVSAMCESVLKHDGMQREFMTEGHLNMDKITSRVSLMYSFLETLNTARIDNINEAYLTDIIINLKK